MRLLFAAALFLALSLQGVEILPAREIRAGMKGYGLSVFKGTDPERFEFEVIDVIRNIYPGQDMVLCEVEHPVVEKAGIVSGMSGSPFYVVQENKQELLMGALAYGWRFNKEPVAGITPAEQMKEGAATAAIPAEGGIQSTALRPLSAPLVIAGALPVRFAQIEELLRPLGFMPVQGGAEGENAGKLGRRLQPGDAVGVRLLSGDMDWTAMGTVTWVEGDQVYAFGHPFRLSGPMRLPMTAAKVHTIIPSLMSSFKLSSALETVGTMEMDHMAAVRGRLGEGPDMLPLSVTCSVKDGRRKEYHYKVARLRALMPMISALAVWDSLDKSLPFNQDCAIEYSIGIDLKEGGGYTLKERVASTSSGAAVFPLMTALSRLIDNNVQRAEVRSLEVHTMLEAGNFRAFIERAEAPNRVLSGQEFTIEVKIRPFGNGPDELKTIPVTLKAPLTGGRRKAMVTISSAQNLHPPRPAPRSPQEYLEVLSRFERPDVLRAVLSENAFVGLTGEGRTLRMLPASAVAALPRMQSTFSEGRETDVQTSYILEGTTSVSVEVEPR